MKTILTGNEAIEAYEQNENVNTSENIIPACGYFTSDDCDLTKNVYDKGIIIAFDSTSGDPYVDAFSTVDEAIDWIKK